jgi:antitoxin StbD
MSALLERASQAVSVTRVSRSAKEILEKLASGQQDRLVVMKNNAPAAVMLSVEAFETLMDELEDLRIDAVARRRLRSLDRRKTIPHSEMMRRFGPSRRK